MNLEKIASKAINDASNAIGVSLSTAELETITSIITRAMEDAVIEASHHHTRACVECLSHDKDLAYKLQKEIELKKTSLIANLSSLR